MAARRLAAILAVLAAAAPPALADTYKWVDDKGVVNYSNAPPPQAAKKQVVEERISIIPPDPALGPAIAAMNARAARQQAYAEADFARRQQYLLAAQASYPMDSCAYGDCGASYAAPAYYYPYGYGGAVFAAQAPWHYRSIATPHRPAVTHHHPRASFHSGGGAMRGGRGSFR